MMWLHIACCRLHSAFKRLSCALVGELVVLTVVWLLAMFVNLNFIIPGEQYAILLMLLICSGCAISGFVWPRRYCDGAERIRVGRLLALGLLVLCLSPTVMVAYIGANVALARRKIVINADSYSWWQFKSAGFVEKKIVPPTATEIQFVLRPGLALWLEAYAEMRCKVSKEDLLAFAKNCGYEFQGESITLNTRKEGPHWDFIHAVWGRYNPGSPYPKEFLSYNDHIGVAGYSFLYDIKNERLYAYWCSEDLFTSPCVCAYPCAVVPDSE